MKRLAALCLLAFAMSAAAQDSPAYAVLYWMQDGTDVSHLYRWQPDTGSVLVAKNVAFDASEGLIIGPWLYYSSFDGSEDDPDTAIWRFPLGGGESDFIADTDCIDFPVAASPDGSQLYVYAVDFDCANVYAVDVETLEIRFLAEEVGRFYGFSPDGASLLTLTRADDAFPLTRTPMDGTGSTVLLETAAGADGPDNFGWIADGTIMFTDPTGEDGPAAYRMQPDGTGIERLTAISRDYVYGDTVKWSPDGQWMAAMWFGANSHMEIHATSDQEVKAMPSISGPRIYAIAWRPDSGALAFYDPDGALSVFDMETRLATQIAAPDENARFAAWLPITAPGEE